MSTFLRFIVLSVVLAFAAPAFAEDAKPAGDPARLAAARDLMQVTGVTKQLEGMMEAMKQGFAKGAKAETSETGKKLSEGFDAAMTKFMAYKDDMITDFAALYAESFTAEEMKTVADFYRSGTGAKFIAMTPELMQKGSVIGMKYSQKVMDDMKASGAAPKP
jgi:uncharacterized protein